MNSTEVLLKQFKPAMKGLWKVCMSLFSSRFYEYLTKYMKLIAQKKQIARILKIWEKFWPFLLKKRAFSRKMGAVMPIFDETDQKKLERK